jgi:hypothetical protein
MDKETEKFMLAQMRDVMEEILKYKEMKDIHKYAKLQINNINTQIKEVSKTDGKSVNK